MIKRAVTVGIFWALITVAVVYFMLLGFSGMSPESAVFIFVLFIMLPVQIGSIAYLTVLIQSNQPKAEN